MGRGAPRGGGAGLEHGGARSRGRGGLASTAAHGGVTGALGCGAGVRVGVLVLHVRGRHLGEGAGQEVCWRLAGAVLLCRGYLGAEQEFGESRDQEYLYEGTHRPVAADGDRVPDLLAHRLAPLQHLQIIL